MQRDHSPPATSAEPAAQLSQMMALLAYLKVAIDDLRAQLAGTHKDRYTVEEFAQLVGRSAYTVRRWITEGRIDAVRISGTGPKGRLLIAHDQLDRLIESGLGGAIPAVATDRAV